MRENPLVRFLNKRTPHRFAALVRASRDNVLNAAYRVLGDRDLAEDVTQEVFLKLLTVKWDPDSIRSWRGLLVSTAVLQARSKLRSEERRVAKERQSAEQDSERDRSLPVEELWDVREAIDSLPAKLRACVELRYFGSLNLKEVASALGLPLRTTTEHLRRAKGLLRARLSPTAGAVLASLLAGEAGAAWPSISPSPGLESRLRELAEHGIVMARVAAGGGLAVGKTYAVAALALLSLGIVAVLAWQPWRADVNSLRGEGGLAPDPGSRLAARSDPALVPAPAGPPTSALGLPGEADSTERPGTRGGQPVGEAPQAVQPAGTGGFSIAVVDESGALVHDGVLSLEPDLLAMPADRIAALAVLAPYEALLTPHSLVHENPLAMHGLPACTLWARARSPGYAPSDEEVVRVEPGRLATIQLVVSSPRTVQVRVLDRESGQPVPGVRVVSTTEVHRRRRDLLDALAEIGPGSGLTGVDGSGVLGGLGAGRHDLELYAQGYETGRVEGADVADAELVVWLAPLRETALIRVTVLDPDGAPVPEVALVLEVEGESALRRVRTDVSGVHLFADVVPGSHTVSIDFDEWAELVRARNFRGLNDCVFRDVRLTKGEEREVVLGFLPGSARVTGEVVGPRGEALSGVEVRIAGPCVRESVSGRAGRVAFERVPAGRYRVTVGGGWMSEPWTVGESDLRHHRWVLGDAAIRGTVLVGGRGVKGVPVLAHGPLFNLTRTSAEGRFSFEGSPPGVYRLSAAVDGFTHKPVVVTVVGSDAAEPVKIELERGARILLRFHDGVGAPLKDVPVRALSEDGMEIDLDLEDAGEDRRGTRPLASGRYTLIFRLPGERERQRTVELQGELDAAVDIGPE